MSDSTELTEEDKKRIEAEELYRAEVRENRGGPEPVGKKVPWWKPKGKAAWLFVIVIFFVIVFNISSTPSENTVSSTDQNENFSLLESEEAKQKIIDDITTTFCEQRSKPYARYVDLEDFIKMYEAKGEIVTLKPVFNAKPNSENCKKVVDICLNLWTEEDCKNIAEQKIWIGMTEDQLILSWGLPNDRNNTVGSWGIHTQWVYDDFGPYVYLEGGNENDMKVTSWQD